MTSIGVAWREARAVRIPSRRPSLTLRAVSLAAAKLPSWQRVRSAVMQTGACAAIDTGLFLNGHSLAGWIGVGVSLFVLEALSGGEREESRARPR